MDESTRHLVRQRAGDRCEYCLLPQEASPLLTFHVEHILRVDPSRLAMVAGPPYSTGRRLIGVPPMSGRIPEFGAAGGNSGLRAMNVDANSDATPVQAADGPSPVQPKAEKDVDILAKLHYLVGGLTALSGLLMIPSALSAWEAAYWTGEEPLSNRTQQLLALVRYMPGLDKPEYDEQILGLTLVMAIVPTMALMLVHGCVLATVGRWIARRRRYVTTFVFSIFNLTHFPLGTAVSLVTLITLRKAEVKVLYGRKPPATRPG